MFRNRDGPAWDWARAAADFVLIAVFSLPVLWYTSFWTGPLLTGRDDLALAAAAISSFFRHAATVVFWIWLACCIAPSARRLKWFMNQSIGGAVLAAAFETLRDCSHSYYILARPLWRGEDMAHWERFGWLWTVFNDYDPLVNLARALALAGIAAFGFVLRRAIGGRARRAPFT